MRSSRLRCWRSRRLAPRPVPSAVLLRWVPCSLLHCCTACVPACRLPACLRAAEDELCAWGLMLESVYLGVQHLPGIRPLLAADLPLQSQLLSTAEWCLSRSRQKCPDLNAQLGVCWALLSLAEMQPGLTAHVASGSGGQLLGRLAECAASLPPQQQDHTSPTAVLSATMLPTILDVATDLSTLLLTRAAGDALAGSGAGRDGDGGRAGVSPLLPPALVQPHLALLRCLPGRLRGLLQQRAAELAGGVSQPPQFTPPPRDAWFARECTLQLKALATLLPLGWDPAESDHSVSRQVRWLWMHAWLAVCACTSSVRAANRVAALPPVSSVTGCPSVCAALLQAVMQLATLHGTELCAAAEALLRMVAAAPLHAGALAGIWQAAGTASASHPSAWCQHAVLAAGHLTLLGTGNAERSTRAEEIVQAILLPNSYSRHAAVELGGRLEPGEAVRQLPPSASWRRLRSRRPACWVPPPGRWQRGQQRQLRRQQRQQ